MEEMGTLKVSSTEVGSLEVSPLKVRLNISMLSPPLVPRLHSSFEDINMLLVCHSFTLRYELLSISFVSLYFILRMDVGSGGAHNI